MMKVYPLREGVTTREVNGVIRRAIHSSVADFEGAVPRDLVGNESIRVSKGQRRYVFGIGTGLRDTLIAHYIPSTRTLAVCFPNDYKGWDRANFYDRLRVVIYDKIVHKSDIRDKSKPGVTLT